MDTSAADVAVRQEILTLRRSVETLAALFWLALALPHTSAFSLSSEPLPEEDFGDAARI
jgi:hypothetical protein